MSNLTRYENQARNTHSVGDIDGDHIVDGRKSSGAPIYQLDLSKPTAVIGYFQLTLSMLRWLPIWFIGGWLFVQYVIVPIILTAPVALFTNKPVALTKTQAGGNLEANTNNLTIGFRSLLGSLTEGIQANQIKTNTGSADQKPSENLVPKARVEFVDN
jgi:hypothetical protein